MKRLVTLCLLLPCLLAAGTRDVCSHPPRVSLSASPTTGRNPLTVGFTAKVKASDGTIVMYSWNFGDGATEAGATLTNPSHIYTTPGMYTATVTVTDDGSVVATASVGITVTSPNTYMYVYDQTVTRVPIAGGRWLGRDVVQIRDDSQAAAAGVTVTATWSGPNTGTLTGVTDASGMLSLETPAVKNPVGTWCFTMTEVQAGAVQFSASRSVITACETPKSLSSRPSVFALEQNYPNPFTTSTQLTFSLPEEGLVRLVVCDLMGRRLRTLVNAKLPAGSHCVLFDGTGLPSGSYSVKLDSPSGRLSRMITLR